MLSIALNPTRRPASADRTARCQFQTVFPVITSSFPTNVIAHLHGLSMDLTVGRTVGPTVDSTDGRPFGHHRHGPKIGGCVPFLGRGAGSPSNKCRLGRCLPSYQVASWSIEPFGHNRYEPNIGGAVPLCGRGHGSPSNRMWPGPRSTCMPSFTLILPTVWPQYTNVTDRTGQTGQTGQNK